MRSQRPSGLLLTGGRSRRMGTDKARLVTAGGSTWARRAARLLAAVTSPTLEVGASASGLEWLDDEEPGGGPLAAMITGWRALTARGAGRGGVIVLACDLPTLEPAVLELLAARPPGASAVPVVEGRPQWCCARYHPALLEAAGGLLESGRRDLRGLAELGVAIDWLEAEVLGALAPSLRDADTPSELAALAPAAGGRR